MGKSRSLISPSLIETNSTYTREWFSFYVYILAGLNVSFCKIFHFFCKDHNKNTIAPDVARHWRKNSILALADLGGGVRDARPPPGRPNSFDFMQFSGKFGVFTPPWRVHAPPSGKSWIRHCLVYIQKKQALNWRVAKNDAMNVVHMLPHDIVE